MRLVAAAVVLLLAPACRRAPVSTSPAVEVSGTPTSQSDGEGPPALIFPPVFLGSSLSQAPGTLYLHVEGVTAEPGSEAEIFVKDPSSRGVDRANSVGSVATVEGSPSMLGTIVLEVHDFEAGGQRYTARSALRGMAGLSVAMIVKRGSVKVERFVLTTATREEREAARKPERSR